LLSLLLCQQPVLMDVGRDLRCITQRLEIK
jgi:hypothetical protein